MHNLKSSQDTLMVFIDILVQVCIQLGAFFWVPNIKEPMQWQTSLDGAGIHIIFILFFLSVKITVHSWEEMLLLLGLVMQSRACRYTSGS